MHVVQDQPSIRREPCLELQKTENARGHVTHVVEDEVEIAYRFIGLELLPGKDVLVRKLTLAQELSCAVKPEGIVLDSVMDYAPLFSGFPTQHHAGKP